MYGITGAFRRFCFDQAVMSFGKALEAELDSVKESKDPKMTRQKKERIMARWLDRPVRYREPVATSSPTAGNTDSEPSGESDV